MHSSNLSKSARQRRIHDATMSALLGFGMLLACLFPPPRAMAEEEVETPHCVCDARTHTQETRSPLVRLPVPLVVRPQGRAIDSGVQACHLDDEASRRNGIGSNLLI